MLTKHSPGVSVVDTKTTDWGSYSLYAFTGTQELAGSIMAPCEAHWGVMWDSSAGHGSWRFKTEQEAQDRFNSIGKVAA